MTTVSEERIEEHFGLVKHVINRYFTRTLLMGEYEYDDLFQYGCYGLLLAIRRFNPDKGATLSTFATRMIWGEILRWTNRDSRLIKIPRTIVEIGWKIGKTGREGMTTEEVMNEFGCSEEDAKLALNVGLVSVTSMDASIRVGGDDDETIDSHELNASVDDESGIYVDEFLSNLNARDRTIIELRRRGMTQTQIGEFFGLSQGHIHRTLKKIGNAFLSYLQGDEVSA